jgi:hypothetical protein
VALLLYAYARGNRSSRGIERECREDVAYRVLAANLAPDHSTIAEFRPRHEAALAGLFGEVLLLCREVGMVKVGVVAIDGTKVSRPTRQVTPTATMSSSRERSWRTPRGSTPKRTRSTASGVVMSSQSS